MRRLDELVGQPRRRETMDDIRKRRQLAFQSGTLRIGMVVSHRTAKHLEDLFCLMDHDYDEVWFAQVLAPVDAINWHPLDMEEHREREKKAGRRIDRARAYILVNRQKYRQLFGTSPWGAEPEKQPQTTRCSHE